jgi:hypothetical protein
MINVNEFYTKVLAGKGSAYCIATITKKGVKHHFVDSLEDIVPKIESLKQDDVQIYFATASFDGYTRKQENAQYFRSLYIDIDAGDNKDYPTKEEGLKALLTFIDDSGLPKPTIVDSGRGIHAYWCLDEDLPRDEYVEYSTKLRDYCLSKGLNIDRAVMGDAARIMRCPDTYNWKVNPPIPTRIISDTITICSAIELSAIIGTVEPSLQDIFKQAKSPLSEDQRRILKLDNFKSNFKTIAIKSLNGTGCAQIANILANAKTLAEPFWYAGLSIAQHCADRDTAIHHMSEDHPGYDRELTERKAMQSQNMPFTCEAFADLDSSICKGCSHKGKISTPLQLGKEFVPAANTEVVPAIGSTELSKPANFDGLPKDLHPFVYGKEGGIYKVHPIVYDEDGVPLPARAPDIVTLYDLYPVKRVYSHHEGEALFMRYHPPQDEAREFIMPMKSLYALDRFRDIIAHEGVLFNPVNQQGKFIMEYIYEWGQYLMARVKAHQLRTQMGFTPDKDAFVIGNKEVTKDGKVIENTTSPTIKTVVKLLRAEGDYDKWKEAANKLNTPGLELHAFTMLTGFGSVLMNRTSTAGATISLTGESGAAKTGALFGALSIWGHNELGVLQMGATDNVLTGRYLTLHNLPFGLDEVSNIDSKVLSNTIHKIAQGRAKLRMQASINAEREYEFSASLIAIFTTNQSLYDKLQSLKKDPNGEVARLVEFNVSKVPVVFEDNPKLAKEIFDTFRLNFGFAGIDYAKHLFTKAPEDIDKLISKWSDKFLETFGTNSVYRFYENLVAATFAGGELAMEAGLVNLDLDRIFKFIVGEMINIRDNVVKINNTDYESMLQEYLNEYTLNTLTFEDNKIIQEPRASLFIRAEMDTSWLYIEKKHFKEYCIKQQVSPNHCIYSLKQKGIDVQEAKKRMGSGWKPTAGLGAVWAYKIPFTKMIEEKLKELTSETEQ